MRFSLESGQEAPTAAVFGDDYSDFIGFTDYRESHNAAPNNISGKSSKLPLTRKRPRLILIIDFAQIPYFNFWPGFSDNRGCLSNLRRHSDVQRCDDDGNDERAGNAGLLRTAVLPVPLLSEIMLRMLWLRLLWIVLR
jgi:hypothetical protein